MPFVDLHIGAVLECDVVEHPDRDFIVNPDRNLHWSYTEFNDRVDQPTDGCSSLLAGRAALLP